MLYLYLFSMPNCGIGPIFVFIGEICTESETCMHACMHVV